MILSHVGGLTSFTHYGSLPRLTAGRRAFTAVVMELSSQYHKVYCWQHSQSVSQSISQSVSQSATHPVCLSVSQCVCLPVCSSMRRLNIPSPILVWLDWQGRLGTRTTTTNHGARDAVAARLHWGAAVGSEAPLGGGSGLVPRGGSDFTSTAVLSPRDVK